MLITAPIAIRFKMLTFIEFLSVTRHVKFATVLKKFIGEVRREAARLPQSEIAGDENHYHHNTNDVENIVHVRFSFLSRDRICP